MNPLILSTIRWTGIAACFVVETLKWVAVVGCFCLFAASCVYFGNKLERSAHYYAQAEGADALEALYGSVKWSAVVESANKKLEAACEKVPKKHKKGICPQESL